MHKFLYLVLAAALAAVTACSGGTAPVDKAADSAAVPEAAEECVVTPPAEPGMCTMEWNPVCGCDGVTYGNACGAKAAGVPRFTEGACEEERTD